MIKFGQEDGDNCVMSPLGRLPTMQGEGEEEQDRESYIKIRKPTWRKSCI